MLCFDFWVSVFIEFTFFIIVFQVFGTSEQKIRFFIPLHKYSTEQNIPRNKIFRCFFSPRSKLNRQRQIKAKHDPNDDRRKSTKLLKHSKKSAESIQTFEKHLSFGNEGHNQFECVENSWKFIAASNYFMSFFLLLIPHRWAVEDTFYMKITHIFSSNLMAERTSSIYLDYVYIGMDICILWSWF